MVVVAETQVLRMYKSQMSLQLFSNEKHDSFYVLVIIEWIDRNCFKYWVLVNVTFFSAGLVLSLKCRFHGNYITDNKLQKAFVNINI